MTPPSIDSEPPASSLGIGCRPFPPAPRCTFLRRSQDAQAKGAGSAGNTTPIRPHSSIGSKTPREFSEECDRKDRWEIDQLLN